MLSADWRLNFHKGKEVTLWGWTGSAQLAFVLVADFHMSYTSGCSQLSLPVCCSSSISRVAFVQGKGRRSFAASLWHTTRVLHPAWRCQWGTAEVALQRIARETLPSPAKLSKPCPCSLLNRTSLQLHSLTSTAEGRALRESPECQQERRLRRNELVDKGGVLLSLLLSGKEKVIRAVWGLDWIIVDSDLLWQKGPANWVQPWALPASSSC